MPLGTSIPAPSPLASGRIGIRVIRLSDAPVLEQLLRENRDWLQPWEATHPNGGTAVPGSVSLRPTIKAMRRQLRAGSGVPFVITVDGAVIGQLSVSEIGGGALRSAQLGYWIAQRSAGNGATPTACALAIDYLFRELRLHRVEICIRPENAPSLRVVEKLRLRYEGRRAAYIHIDGAWRDHDCFAITAEELGAGMLSRLGASPDAEVRPPVQ